MLFFLKQFYTLLYLLARNIAIILPVLQGEIMDNKRLRQSSNFFSIKDTESVWFSLSFQQNLGLKAILQLHTALVLWDFIIWVCVCKLSNANVNLLLQYLGWVLGTQKRKGRLKSIATRSISTEPYFVHMSVTNIYK